MQHSMFTTWWQHQRFEKFDGETIHLFSLFGSVLQVSANMIRSFWASEREMLYMWKSEVQPRSSLAPTEYTVSATSVGKLR